MKKQILFFFLLIHILGFSQQVNEKFVVPKNAKIGLSLSGGGAKGFAHIGVLKVIDSLGIKVDYISGTSIGAIIGGLYASGYSGKEIEKMVKENNYSPFSKQGNRADASFFDKSVDKYILKVPFSKGKVTFPSSLSSNQQNIYLLKELFKNTNRDQDFSKLPIPFMCVATNLETGKIKIFEKGDLSEAVMASSAFPSLMDPVKVGDSLYVDGALTINYPSEPLRKKGMDIIIGVNLNQGLNTREKINGIVDIFNQVIDFGIVKETKTQQELTDINIHPNLENLGVTSFDSKEKIILVGTKEAEKYIEILQKLPKRESEQNISSHSLFASVFKIDRLQLENSSIYNKAYVLGKMNLRLPSLHTYSKINTMVDKLYSTNNYKSITYDIIQDEGENVLNLNVEEDNNRLFLKFGLHYDDIFKSGLLANVTVKRLFFKNSNLSLDAILGDNPRYYFNYFIDNGYIPGIGFYASGMRFDLKNKNGVAQDRWKWFRSEVYLQSVWDETFAVGGGITHDYFSSNMVGTENYIIEKNVTPFVFIKGDNQDSKSFPKKGFFTEIEARAFNVFDASKERAFQIKADIRGSFPINKWLTYRITSSYGMSINPVSSFYQYRLGGLFEQKLGNFIRFNGYEFGQEFNNNVIQVSNFLQFNPYGNYYLIANLNFANLFDDFKDTDFLKVRYKAVGLTLGYDSPFGQIKINYSHSLKNNPGIFSVILGHWF